MDRSRACTAREARLRSGLQSGRIVRRQRHGGLLHRRVPRADRQALHRLRFARSALRAGQGGREEDPRVPRHPHAGLRALVPRAPRFLARPRVSRHRQARARRRLDRHRVQRRRDVDPRVDGADRLAARELRLAGPDRGVRRGARDVRRRHRQRQARRRCLSSSSICRSFPRERRASPARR